MPSTSMVTQLDTTWLQARGVLPLEHQRSRMSPQASLAKQPEASKWTRATRRMEPASSRVPCAKMGRPSGYASGARVCAVRSPCEAKRPHGMLDHEFLGSGGPHGFQRPHGLQQLRSVNSRVYTCQMVGPRRCTSDARRARQEQSPTSLAMPLPSMSPPLFASPAANGRGRFGHHVAPTTETVPYAGLGCTSTIPKAYGPKASQTRVTPSYRPGRTHRQLSGLRLTDGEAVGSGDLVGYGDPIAPQESRQGGCPKENNEEHVRE